MLLMLLLLMMMMMLRLLMLLLLLLLLMLVLVVGMGVVLLECLTDGVGVVMRAGGGGVVSDGAELGGRLSVSGKRRRR